MCAPFVLGLRVEESTERKLGILYRQNEMPGNAILFPIYGRLPKLDAAGSSPVSLRTISAPLSFFETPGTKTRLIRSPKRDNQKRYVLDFGRKAILGSWHSTTELLPRFQQLTVQCPHLSTTVSTIIAKNAIESSWHSGRTPKREIARLFLSPKLEDGRFRLNAPDHKSDRHLAIHSILRMRLSL